MISVMKGALGPKTTYPDKVMYLTSLELNLSMCFNDDDKINEKKIRTVVDTIINLTTTCETRLAGLQVLEKYLKQNPQNAYNRGRWFIIACNVIKDPKAGCIEKKQACNVLAVIIPLMVNNASFDSIKEELTKDVFPFFLEKIDENVEWSGEASVCVKLCLQSFPKLVAFSQMKVLQVILHQSSRCISSKSFEVLAECFAELPNCVKETNDNGFKERWKTLYLRTLKTIESHLVASLNNEPYSVVGINAKEFVFEEDSGDFLPDFTKRVRQFINMCKCLAKLLSVKSRYPVTAPVYPTLKLLLQLFSVCRKDNVESSQQEVLFTFISQMRLSGLAILESLILNCHLLKYTILMCNLIRASIDTSVSPISSTIISEQRIATWKVLSLWLDGYGALVSKDIINVEYHVVEELLKDISIRELVQDSETKQENNKSKKNVNKNSNNLLIRNNEEKVCIAALDSLDSLLSAGLRKMSKELFQNVCSHIFKTCEAIDFSRDLIPLPYDAESCREKLYSVVLVVIENVKPDDHKLLQTAMKILRYITQDPSYKVKKLINRASSKCRLQFYPNRQHPVLDTKKKEIIAVNNMNLWASQEYTPNLKLQSTSESLNNLNIKIEPFSSENEADTHSEEYMEVERHFPEQAVENQCNGEEIDIQSSSQCQDDVDSDEEEEEEEEERSFADEEMNQEEHPQEMYIPTPRSIETSPHVQINAEIVQNTVEPEYEELTPCIKIEENTINSSNKDKCLNGERKIGHDENAPSSSTQKMNENGIFGIDDNDFEDNEDEEEEENCDSYSGEKRVECYEQSSAKKQKIETNIMSDVDERKEKEKSPTLEEMKADFLESLPSLEDVKSGKVQLSSP